MNGISTQQQHTNKSHTNVVVTHEHTSNDEATIFYALIAFNTDLVVEVNQYAGDDAEKFIKASKKILRRLKRYEIRRPDGMSTLIGGTLSYNFILGYEYCNHEVHPLLDSITFLCVLPLHRYNQNVTSSEREIAFKFLSSMRRDFLTSFLENLYTIHNHPRLDCIAARINCSQSDDDDDSHDTDNNSGDRTRTRGNASAGYILSEEDENLRHNLHELSHVMQQRMHGNYAERFRYKALGNATDAADDDVDVVDLDVDEIAATLLKDMKLDVNVDNAMDANDDNNHGNGNGNEAKQLVDPVDDDDEGDEESQDYVELRTPAMKSYNDSRSTSHSNGHSHSHSQSTSTSGGDNGFVAVDAMDGNNYGSIIDESTEIVGSRSTNFSDFLNDSFVDVTRRMRERMKASMSATSLKSLASNTALSEDKFVDFETMPLIGSSVNIMSGPYVADYYDDGRRSQQTFLCRHRNKLGGLTVACMLLIYFVIAMFCGWNVQSCVP
eukprot:CAMPEP_0202685748 /NCGR_PEP_ID=MMETSP1385-20130828/1575_1 /ASSEMBLY_ACC=CAM_ASM_000861 /TAXON_ID=933848 /ORGANISM="Elphidium margaritaceum" /LENGTH=494 /DNA_ID=CAMNT_0049340177 /DNA_START=41 /DNA_END=1525 /DNA_ORIENTATION=-